MGLGVARVSGSIGSGLINLIVLGSFPSIKGGRDALGCIGSH